MIAIIETGGKQFIVGSNVALTIPHLTAGKGESITFDKVLLLADEEKGTVQVGTPYIEGASFTALVTGETKKKITVIKYKPKVRYRRKVGHTQKMTKVKVGDIK